MTHYVSFTFGNAGGKEVRVLEHAHLTLDACYIFSVVIPKSKTKNSGRGLVPSSALVAVHSC